MSALSPCGRCVGRHRQWSAGGGGLALPSPRQTQASCQLRAGHRSKAEDRWRNKVEVTQEHIGRDSGPCLTANPSSCSLEWDGSRAQQTGAWAGGTVVTQSIEAAPAGAECRDKGQLQAQAAQQHHTVRRWLEPELRGSFHPDNVDLCSHVMSYACAAFCRGAAAL